MSKVEIKDIKELRIDHLKDYQRADLLALHTKYTLQNAMENVAEKLQPVMQDVIKGLNKFFDSVHKIIEENKDGNTK